MVSALAQRAVTTAVRVDDPDPAREDAPVVERDLTVLATVGGLGRRGCDRDGQDQGGGC